jgi:hypothetical protein
MRKRFLALPVVGLVLGLTGAVPAQAHDHGTTAARPVAITAADLPHFFAASLSGQGVADPDGAGSALVVVQGSQVTFAVSWRNIPAPTAAHIHRGVAGTNGPVVVPFWGSVMPATVNAAAGATTVTDPQIAADIVANPAGFYVNLHTPEFPGGAIRSQLGALTRPADVLSFLRGGPLHALLDGDEEVAGGDADGRALAFVTVRTDSVDFALMWSNIPAPVAGHIHQGARGVNGPVVVPFFAGAVPAGIFAISGTMTGVSPTLTQQIRANPRGFYANLHTTEFPGGAVRGQLFG